MKLTFPRLGDSHIYGRLLFSELGVEIVIPSANTSKGLERGAAISPEDICLPFKIMADNLISASLEGADTVVMPATMGPCRLGQYGELLKTILAKQGYDFQWILLDSTKAIGIRELLRRLNSLISSSHCSRTKVMASLAKTYRLIRNFERLEAEARILSAKDKRKGDTKRILRSCRNQLLKAEGINRGLEIVREAKKKLRNAERDPTAKPLKFLLTGEIYTLIEPFANHYIEESLMDAGVSFVKNISIGWWIKNTILNPLGGLMAEKKANPYLQYRIGGYAKETIGDVLKYKKNNYDGVIHILPAGCMPEIVAKSVFQGLSENESLPVLSIIYDEMGGQAGYLTRVEAFIDMVERKKENQNVLSGNRRRVSEH